MRAFTLIEMLLVIVIIGVLASAVVVSIGGRSEEARIVRTRSDIEGTLSLALDMFEVDTGRYPTSEEGLDALVSNPGIDGWRQAYLKGGLKPDAWGNPYQYQRRADGQGYELRSAGPDGALHSDDDIVGGDQDD